MNPPSDLLHDAGRQFFVVEEGDECAFAFADESEGLELLDDAGKGVVVEGFAANQIEGDTEAGIDAVEFGHREVDEGLPESAVLGVAGLQFDEFGAGLVLPDGVFLAFLVREHVDPLEFVDGRGFEGGGIEKGAVAHDQNAELRAPVAEMVVAENRIAQGAVRCV